MNLEPVAVSSSLPRPSARFTLKFIAMAPDEALLDLARQFSVTSLRSTHATVQKVSAIDGYRARVQFARHEASVEAANALEALQEAFRSLRAMVAGSPEGIRLLTSETDCELA